MDDFFLPPPAGDTQCRIVIDKLVFVTREDATRHLKAQGFSVTQAHDYLDALVAQYHLEIEVGL